MKREMTEEQRQKLLGVLPVSDSGLPYPIERLFKGLEEFAPKIKVRAMSNKEQTDFNNSVKDKNADYDKLIDETSFRCVTDIGPVINLDTLEEFEVKSLSDYSKLPFNLKMDIFDFIKKITGLLPVEKEGLE